MVHQDPLAIVLPFFEGVKGNPVLFSAAYRTAILEHKNPEGCRELVQAHSKCIDQVSVDDVGVLQDIDTPEDYQNLS